MADYQQGPQTGTVVGREDRGSVRDVLGPESATGQATMLFLGSLIVLALLAPRNDRGIAGKVAFVAGTIATVGLGSIASQYLFRFYTLRHPDAPGAAGLAIVG